MSEPVISLLPYGVLVVAFVCVVIYAILSHRGGHHE